MPHGMLLFLLGLSTGLLEQRVTQLALKFFLAADSLTSAERPGKRVLRVVYVAAAFHLRRQK